MEKKLEHLNERESPLKDWNTVKFPDGFRFSVLLESGHGWVWRLCDQIFDAKSLQPTMKCSSISVMV